MSFLYMEFSWEEDNQYTLEKRKSINMDMGMMSRNDSNQFWPLEHPIEPLDGPVKCPTLISPSLINDGNVQKNQFTGRLWKRATDQISNGQSRRVVAAGAAEPPPLRAFRKRHHTLTRSVDNAVKPLLRTSSLHHYQTKNLTISDMLHQFNKFDS